MLRLFAVALSGPPLGKPADPPPFRRVATSFDAAEADVRKVPDGGAKRALQADADEVSGVPVHGTVTVRRKVGRAVA